MRYINQSGSKINRPDIPFLRPPPSPPPYGGFLFLVVSGLLWVSWALRLPGLVPAPFLPPPPLIFCPKFSGLGLSTCAHQVNEGGKRRQRSGRLAARLIIVFCCHPPPKFICGSRCGQFAFSTRHSLLSNLSQFVALCTDTSLLIGQASLLLFACTYTFA